MAPSHGADEHLTRDVAELIVAHEVGGTHEADLVQAADRLSSRPTSTCSSGSSSPGVFDRRRADEIRALVPQDPRPGCEGAALPLYENADARLGLLAASNGNGDGKTPTESNDSR